MTQSCSFPFNWRGKPFLPSAQTPLFPIVPTGPGKAYSTVSRQLLVFSVRPCVNGECSGFRAADVRSDQSRR